MAATANAIGIARCDIKRIIACEGDAKRNMINAASPTCAAMVNAANNSFVVEKSGAINNNQETAFYPCGMKNS